MTTETAPPPPPDRPPPAPPSSSSTSRSPSASARSGGPPPTPTSPAGRPAGRRRPRPRRPGGLGAARRAGQRHRLRPGARPRPADRGAGRGRRRAVARQDLAQRLHHHQPPAVLTEPASATWSPAASAPSSACETTTRLASDLGYEVTFVTDATATEPIAAPGRCRRPPAGGDPRRPADAVAARVIDRTEYALAGRFATIRTVTSVDRRELADRIVTRVVFLLVPQLHLLDLAGPAQVFSTAADLGLRLRAALRRRAGGRAHRAGRAAAAPRPGGRELGPDDLVVVPGWRSSSLRGPHGPVGAADPAAAGRAPRGRRHRGQRLRRRGRPRPGRAARRPPLHHPPRRAGRTGPPLPAGRRWSATCSTSVDGRVVTSAGHRQRHRPRAAPGRHAARAGRAAARSPGRWSSTRGATATSSRPARCCGTAAHLSDAVHRVQDLIDARFADRLAAGRTRRRVAGSASAP